MSARIVLLRDLREAQAELAVLTAKVEQLCIRVEAAEDFELVGDSVATPECATGSHNDPVREEAAKETGRFFVRCLEGRPRGDSGRSKVRLQNRIFVVVRTFAGDIHRDPVLVFTQFSEAKKLVCHPDCASFGDSIFSGFPSKWEAQLAVSTAGFSWP
eukprot:Skav235420  [mRNA]  locus=scaffold924:200484:200957:+ [translate_table: standard]